MIQSNSIYKYVACCICQSKTIRAHRLPALSTNDEKLLRYAKWVNFAAIEKVYNKRKYYWICEIHFEDNAFCNHLKLKLLRTAVPTLNPPIYEGPSTEDGTLPGPTESKDNTLLKIFEEVSGRQCKNETVGKRRKFYNFISTSPGESGPETISQEKENQLRTDIQRNLPTKENLKQVSLDNVKDVITLPIIDEALSPNRSFKTPAKVANNQEGIEKGSSGSANLFLNQRTRPLILKKSTLSSKPHSSIIRPSLLKTHLNVDSSDRLINPNLTQSLMKTFNQISAVNVTKPDSANDYLLEILQSSAKKPEIDVISTTTDHLNKEGMNESNANENIYEIPDSVSSVVDLTSNEKGKQLDILSTAINNSEILFSDISCMDEEIICDNKETDNKHNQTLKSVKKKKAVKKKYYDPVLIDSILNKMKLKKNGPVCVVTLEKKPDKIFKGFSKNKLVTLYKQQIHKNRKNKKVNQGINKNSNEISKKVRKKRRCTCSIHCRRRSNGSKISSPVVNVVNSGIGVKFEGTAVNPNITNMDPDLADEELFNVENVFNVSTILTNVHDRSQIEQLCQMLIESIFRLKSLNVEGTMGKLQVYLAQMPESGVNRSGVNEQTLTCEDNANSSNEYIEMNDVVESDTLSSPEVIIDGFQESDCNQIPSFISSTNEKEIPTYNDVPVTNESPYQPVNDTNVNNQHHTQIKPKNVKVRLSTFHDHSYVKQESNYIFQKPEYLVKLINVETYRCPRKTVKPPQSGASKKEVERHKKTCVKLNNRIIHLRELIKKKNKNMKLMHKKIKYLGGIVCKEKGIKRVKYPKVTENLSEKKMHSLETVSEDHLQVNRGDEAKILIEMNVDQLRTDNVVSINSFDSASYFHDNTQIKAMKAHGTKMKKNMGAESFDILYENLIEELCSNEMEY